MQSLKGFVISAVMLFLCSASVAQTANFSTHTKILDIPNFTIDYGIAYKDVEFIMDSNGESFSLAQFTKLPNSLNLPQLISLKLGESIILSEELILSFTHVLSDNRCPSDLACITAGEAVVILQLTESPEKGLIDRAIFGLSITGGNLISGRAAQYLEIKGLYFNLIEVAPRPVSIEQLTDEDYEIIVEYVAVPRPVPRPNQLVSPK